eukprot:6300153-Prymnesium_polylepis.1
MSHACVQRGAAQGWSRDRSACELVCTVSVRGAGYCGRGARSARSDASMLQLVWIAARRVCRRRAKGGVGGEGCQP